MSDFFDASGNRISDGLTARASDVNTLRDEVGAGFDLLPDKANLNNGTVNYAVDSGAADAYVVAMPQTATSYADGLLVSFKAANANTGAATINVDSLGVKSLKRQSGAALVAGDITANKISTFRYNSTSGTFELMQATLNSPLPVSDGGTGRATSTTAYGLIAAGTTATGAHQTLAAGLTTEMLVGGGASALPVWTAATGSGAPVRATSPTLVTPALGVATATSVNVLMLFATTSSSSMSIGIGGSLTAPSVAGASNLGIGGTALFRTTSGEGNTDLNAGMVWNVTGNNNTGVGRGALANVTASTNTGIGYRAGISITSGENDTCLGADAAPSSATVSNEITLGNSSIATLRCQVTSITSLSDRRDKTDITPLAAGIDVVMALRPVRFTWDMRDGGKVGIKDAGFIAQDLQEIDDDWLKLVYSENPEKLEASYGRLIPVMVRAIQELKQEVDSLRAQLLG